MTSPPPVIWMELYKQRYVSETTVRQLLDAIENIASAVDADARYRATALAMDRRASMLDLLGEEVDGE